MIAVTIGDYEAYNTSAGNVDDIVIRNIQPCNSLTALKLCGQKGYKYKNVLVEQVYGTTTHEGFYLRSDGPILNDFTLTEPSSIVYGKSMPEVYCDLLNNSIS